MGVYLKAKSFHGICSQDVRVAGFSKEHERLDRTTPVVDVCPTDIANHGLPVRKLVFLPPLPPDAHASDEPGREN